MGHKKKLVTSGHLARIYRMVPNDQLRALYATYLTMAAAGDDANARERLKAIIAECQQRRIPLPESQ